MALTKFPLLSPVSAGCGRTGVLCIVDYVRQLLLTQVLVEGCIDTVRVREGVAQDL